VPAATLVRLHGDLRLHDQPALAAALAAGGAVIPVFVWNPDEEEPWAPGGASRWWLQASLAAFDARLRGLGSRLVLRRGPLLETLLTLVRETGARSIHWNRRHEPDLAARDTACAQALRAEGLCVQTFEAGLLFEHGAIHSAAGEPYTVFTPFWRRCLQAPPPPPPRPAPGYLPPPATWPHGEPLEALGLQPVPDWAAGLRATWAPGEAGARTRLERFEEEALADYASARDLPAQEGVSRLSPHLHFGEISPRLLWQRLQGRGPGAEAWLRQLGWREFAHQLLHHHPRTPHEELRPEFAAFPWREDRAALRAWRRGRTGYPWIDAAMRELWNTGWMHNRPRMAVASFLVKDLLQPWQQGARWFWDTLVDADLANNTLGWQWAAGCGADAAPYFRIYNPVRQGERFDPQGAYIRRWLPELAALPVKWIHRPWEAPAAVLAQAGLWLGRDYPLPIVDHAAARDRALAAWSQLRGRE
jgi:deoxyribodipyrimidine photo-lyase